MSVATADCIMNRRIAILSMARFYGFYGVIEFDFAGLHHGTYSDDGCTHDNHSKAKVLRNSQAIKSEGVIVTQELD